jgi:hypothetical protein
MGVPTPQPFSGENIPGLWNALTTKVFVENVPAVVFPTEAPMCKPHGGPLGAVGPGMPMGLGKGKFVVSGATRVKMEGKIACAEPASITLNSQNTPPAQVKKGNPIVVIS